MRVAFPSSFRLSFNLSVFGFCVCNTTHNVDLRGSKNSSIQQTIEAFVRDLPQLLLRHSLWCRVPPVGNHWRKKVSIEVSLYFANPLVNCILYVIRILISDMQNDRT